MASTVTITCPECDKTLRAPSEVLGKKIRCKGCGATFSARAAADEDDDAPPPRPKKAPAAKAVPARPKNDKPKAKADDDDDDASGYGVTTEYLGPRCPSCANAMEEEQRICLTCGYDTETRVQSRTRKVRHTSGGDIFLWLLPGILCAILTLGLLTAQLLYIIFIVRETFGDAWYDFIGSLGMKVWTSVVVLFICYYAGKYAIIRLCIDNTPPEVELH
jgi:hypothetical protein